MTSELLLTLLTDPQGFWKLLQQYFTVPFTGDSADTAVLSMFWESVLNHPLWLLVAVIFLFLLFITLLVCRIGIACESHSEKKERENRQLAHYQEHCEKTAAFELLAEREVSYDI